MRKLATILGISVISAAVALAPAFAQQTQPPGAGGSTPVQPQSDVKSQAADQAGNVRSGNPSPAKTETNAKNEAVSGKPAPDVKAGSTSSKTDNGAKDQKGNHGKPGANLKSTKPVKSASHDKSLTMPKHHAKQPKGKAASKMRAKTRASNPDTRKKTGKS